MNETVRTDVDARPLKSGQVRLRFRLNNDAHSLVTTAMMMTGYENPGAALDAIAMSSHAGHPASPALASPSNGRKRLLVRLWPDQHENVRLALDVARDHVKTDDDALYFICAGFLLGESIAAECIPLCS